MSDQPLKNKLISLLKDANKIEIIPEVEQLAKIYIKAGIIPVRYENDAIHIALTTVYSIDILVSWNFKHLVRRNTRIGVNLN